jgi:hypothetical protein
MAQLAADIPLRDVAADLLTRLEPFCGQLVVLSWGETILGAADRYVATVRSAVTGTVDHAGFEAARTVEERAGATIAVARTEAARARAAAVAM